MSPGTVPVGLKPGVPAFPPTRHLGPLVSKLCDRIMQEEEFSAFFSLHLRQHPGLPQIYLVRGVESERPDSLVERFCWTSIQDYANYKWGEQSGAVKIKLTEWPPDGDLTQRQHHLISWLFKQFNPAYEFAYADFSAAAFARLSALTLNPIIVLRHDIRTGRWDKETRSVIEWYLRFWDEVGNLAPKSQFLIFLNLIYPHPESGSWWKAWLKSSRFNKKRIEKELEELRLARQGAEQREPQRRTCPGLFMQELTCVEWDAVMSWFSQHQIFDDMKIWRDKCSQIFRGSHCRHMEDIEHALSEIQKEFIKEGRHL